MLNFTRTLYIFVFFGGGDAIIHDKFNRITHENGLSEVGPNFSRLKVWMRNRQKESWFKHGYFNLAPFGLWDEKSEPIVTNISFGIVVLTWAHFVTVKKLLKLFLRLVALNEHHCTRAWHFFSFFHKVLQSDIKSMSANKVQISYWITFVTQ